MVFVNKEWNGTGGIVVYSNYHKYWQNRELQIKNPLFDIYSGRILDLKEGKDSAVNYFYSLLKDEICEGVTICVVPSSSAAKTVTGMTKLGEMLAKDKRIDKAYYLIREKSIEKLAYGGKRDIEVHLQSIGTAKDIAISGDVILLMDDVTTTGNSLYACKEIMMQNGAHIVEMFALGKAV